MEEMSLDALEILLDGAVRRVIVSAGACGYMLDVALVYAYHVIDEGAR